MRYRNLLDFVFCDLHGNDHSPELFDGELNLPLYDQEVAEWDAAFGFDWKAFLGLGERASFHWKNINMGLPQLSDPIGPDHPALEHYHEDFETSGPYAISMS